MNCEEIKSRARALIDSGRYAEAYGVLTKHKSGKGVEKMLDCFEIVYKTAEEKCVSPDGTPFEEYKAENYIRTVSFSEYNEEEYEEEDGSVACIAYDSDFHIVHQRKRIYNENGFLTSSLSSGGENACNIKELRYDEFDNLLSKTVKSIDGEIIESIVFDEFAIAKKVISYSEIADSSNAVCEYTYSDNGKLLYRTRKNANGDIVEACEFDENRNPIKTTVFCDDGTVFERTSEYLYDENGIILQEKCYENGCLSFFAEFSSPSVYCKESASTACRAFYEV